MNYREQDRKVFSIKEVSEILGVPAHTIRFWEKDFGIYLKPERTTGGQRRYRSKDIEVIEKIKYFPYEKQYTIAGTINEMKNNNKKTLKDSELKNMVGDIAEMIRERIGG